MGIPLPPGAKKPEQGKETIGDEETQPRLNEDEVSFILRTTLLPEHRLDPNILRWIHNYLSCRDAKQAAIDAGLTPKSGEHLKRRPDIHAAISAITEKALIKFGYDAAEVVEKVKEIAFVDPIEFENEDGSFKEHLQDISPEARRTIKKFKAKNLYEKDPNGMDVVVGKLIEVEFYDKMAATKLLGVEKDVFVDKKKVEHSVSSDMKSLLLESRARAEAHKEKMLGSGPQTTPTEITARLEEVIDVTPAQESSGGD